MLWEALGPIKAGMKGQKSIALRGSMASAVPRRRVNLGVRGSYLARPSDDVTARSHDDIHFRRMRPVD